MSNLPYRVKVQGSTVAAFAGIVDATKDMQKRLSEMMSEELEHCEVTLAFVTEPI